MLATEIKLGHQKNREDSKKEGISSQRRIVFHPAILLHRADFRGALYNNLSDHFVEMFGLAKREMMKSGRWARAGLYESQTRMLMASSGSPNVYA